MEQIVASDSKLLYRAEIHFSSVVEYGFSMEALSMGTEAVPPAGARFDQAFEGILHGPVLRGQIWGTDYLYIRADGLYQLHLHARVTTDDGVNISLASQGVSMQIDGESLAQLRAAVSLFSSSETYRWLSKLQVWAVGTFDPIKAKAHIQAYAA